MQNPVQRRRRLAHVRHLLIITALLLAVSPMSGSSLSPGEELLTTFTSSPNTSDMLIFFTNDPLTLTGSPLITTKLFNGPDLLGTITAPPALFAGTEFYQNFFLTPSSPFVELGETATVDLSSMQNGTIKGLLEVTISGGSMSGFNLSDFVLIDAESVGSDGYRPQLDLNGGDAFPVVTLVSTPEPAAWTLLLIGLFGLLPILLRRSRPFVPRSGATHRVLP